MAFNFFKKKEQEKPQPKVQKPAAIKQEEHEVAPKEAEGTKKKAKKTFLLPGVLMNPHITEKASMLGERGQYVFRVYPQATKGAVKSAIESLYGVEVRKVRMIKKPAKKIRIGKKEGVKPGLKKAVVQFKAGQSMEIISR